jgi:protein SCO1/2
LQYAKRYGYDPAHWSFLTGALIDVDAITEQFGLYFVREQGAINFDHNLRTVVIDPQGRIHKLYVGNTWTPAELVADLVQLAGAAPSPTQ